MCRVFLHESEICLIRKVPRQLKKQKTVDAQIGKEELSSIFKWGY